MKDKKMVRTLWGAILVLMLINIGMMCWIWFMPKMPNQPERFFLERELNFDENQRNAYRKMRKEHFDGNHEIHEQIKIKKEAFIKQMTKSNLSDEELMTQSVEIETMAAQINVRNYKHLQAVKKMCTPEQQQKFDEIMDKIAFQISKPQMPPRPNGKEGEMPPPPRNEGDEPPPMER